MRKRKESRVPNVRGLLFLGKLSQSIVVISWFMSYINLSTFSSVHHCQERVQHFLIWKNIMMDKKPVFDPVALKSLPHPSPALFFVTPQRLGPQSTLLYGFGLGLASGIIIGKLKHMRKKGSRKLLFLCLLESVLSIGYILHGSPCHEVTHTQTSIPFGPQSSNTYCC